MFKCIKEDLTSWRDGKTKWTPGKWMPLIKNKSGDCECGTGYHLGLSLDHAIRYGEMPCRVWTAEGKEKYGEDNCKRRYGKARIIEDVTPDYINAANDFIHSIKKVRWFSQCKSPLKSWRIFDTWSAAEDAAYAAAGVNEWDSDLSALNTAITRAARSAYRICAARVAMSAALRAAQEVIWDSAGDTCGYIYREAGWDAGLMAQIKVCGGLELDKKHIKYAEARWDVWLRGYVTVCDVNGILYVCMKP